MGDIADADYAHAERICKDFEVKNLEEFRDLYAQSNVLLLIYLRTFVMCLEIYEFDLAKFLSPPRLEWQAASNKTKVKVDLLTDIDMLLMLEKGIRRGICHSVYCYPKTNNKYLKNYDRNKESPDLQYWNIYNLYAWATS